MRKCPKCNTKVPNKINFCSNCGYSFSKERERTIQLIFWAIGAVILLFLAILFSNYMYEKRNIVPLEYNALYGDTIVNIQSIFDKTDQKIYTDFNTKEKIEKWQVEKMKNKSIEPVMLIKPTNTNHTCEKVILNVDENLSIHCEIDNSNIKDFVVLKKNLKAGEVSIGVPNEIHLDSKIRNKEKQAYLAEQEKLRQQREAAARQEAERQRMMNMLFNPYSYYGGYYY